MVPKKTIYGISLVAKRSRMGFSWFPRKPWTKLVFNTTGKNRLKTYLLTLEEVSGFPVWSWHGSQENIYGISMVAKKSMMSISWFPRTPWTKLVFTTTGKNRLKTYLLTIEEVSGFPVWSWHGSQENHLWYFNGCQEIHDVYFMVPKNTMNKTRFYYNW